MRWELVGIYRKVPMGENGKVTTSHVIWVELSFAQVHKVYCRRSLVLEVCDQQTDASDDVVHGRITNRKSFSLETLDSIFLYIMLQRTASEQTEPVTPFDTWLSPSTPHPLIVHLEQPVWPE
jgi:hypothetical protein